MSELVDRPSWQDYFFKIAKDISQRSSCPSRKVGAVIIDPETQHIKSTGFNGAARGTPHCSSDCLTRESGKSWKKCNAIHAELNAIISAAQNGVSTNGSHMYLTTTPCVFCSRIIINAGITKVYALTYYPAPEALELLMIGGVEVVVVNGDTLFTQGVTSGRS